MDSSDQVVVDHRLARGRGKSVRRSRHLLDGLRSRSHELAAPPDEELLHTVRQSLVGGVLVGEHRVSARLGQDVSPSHRDGRRGGHVRPVGVPRLCRCFGLPEVGHDGDLRVTVERVLGVVPGQERLAEDPGQAHVVVRIEELTPQHENAMVVEGRPERVLLGRGDVGGQVDAGETHTDRPGERLEPYRAVRVRPVHLWVR